MRYALIIVLGACYYLGWLPASFVVPALLVFSVLRVPTGGRTPRRGGYIAVPPSASGGASQTTAQRVATYTGFSSMSGPVWAGGITSTAQAVASRITAPGYSGTPPAATGAPGLLTTDAEPPDWYLRSYAQRLADPRERFSPFAPPGDCGCGDTAA